MVSLDLLVVPVVGESSTPCPASQCTAASGGSQAGDLPHSLSRSSHLLL